MTEIAAHEPEIQPTEAMKMRFSIPTEGGYQKWISDETHDRMHQALALAARSGHLNIPCEACGEMSSTIGPIDTRYAETMLKTMAEQAQQVEDESPFAMPIQPHRRRLYPDLPPDWQRMTFDTLKIDDGNRDVVTVVQAWIEMPGGVLVLMGSTGVGKTHLLSSATHELIEKKADVSAWEFDDWHQTLRGVFDSGREEIEAFEHRMLRCGFLVLDDIRAENTSQGVREMFERIVHRRTQEGKQILLTTNASEEEWRTWSARAYSRLRARAYATWLVMVDRDRRLAA